MTTSTYKHFGRVGKKDYTNTDRTILPSILMKTAVLILIVVTATSLFIQKRNNNITGHSTHVCRVDSTTPDELIVDLIKTLSVRHPTISQTIEKLNQKFPGKRESIIKIIQTKCMYVEPQNYKELEPLNYILECLLLSPVKDKEEFIATITSGPFIRYAFTTEEVDDELNEVYRANGDNTETLKIIFDLLAGDHIVFKEIKKVLTINFLMGFGFIDKGIAEFEHNISIKEMFSCSDKNNDKELLKQLRNKEEESFSIIASMHDFGNSLLLGEECFRPGLIEYLHTKNIFKNLLYDCLDSLIDSKSDASANSIIEAFIGAYKIDFNNRDEVYNFEVGRDAIIIRFKKFIVDNITNKTLTSFVENIEDKLHRVKVERKK